MRIAASLLLISLQMFVRGRDFSYADSVTFLGTEGTASNLVKMVFAVHLVGDQSNVNAADDWRNVGSGFFVIGTNKAVIGITCEHVIRKPAALRQTFFIGLDADDGYKRFPARILYVDSTNDIAVIAPLVPDATITNLTIRNLLFSENLFDDGKSTVEGRGVLITGYPLGLGTEGDKNHPVVRFGMIAQNTPRDTFLIDGVASPGNSGSPVMALRYKEPRLVGMITSYVPDKISLYSENGSITAQLPYNSGLARAIRIGVIRRAIEHANKILGSEK